MEGIAAEAGTPLGDLAFGMNGAFQEMRGGFPVHVEIRQKLARAVDEARPYRQFFPPGAPNRD